MGGACPLPGVLYRGGVIVLVRASSGKACASAMMSLGLQLIAPYIHSIDIKDFRWTVQDGEWRAHNLPLGQGMVDFKQYFAMLKAGGFSGPVQLHMEYHELGGADRGRSQLTAPKAQVLKLMRQDIETLKRMLGDAELA